MKIITIVGARPQFIKAAVVSREIALNGKIEEIIVHTGQHFDSNMSGVFFEEMEIPRPLVNLNINDMGHGEMTGKMLESIEKILISHRPDLVLVYGDTNSTLAAALAAKKLGINVAHIEAGLRSFNMKMPEEINRIVTDRLSDILFCPTDNAIINLNKEGFENFNVKIIKSGDVMQDAALYYSNKSRKPDFDLPAKFVLTTVHRAENTDDNIKLKNIFFALEEISKEIPIVLPLHPRTKQKLVAINYNFSISNICFATPIGYLEMVYLLKNCEMVITDSGGLQKEAYFFSKLCVTLREETEWQELVDNKFNLLAGSDVEKILSGFEAIRNSENIDFKNRMYGNGDAGKIIENFLNGLYN